MEPKPLSKPDSRGLHRGQYQSALEEVEAVQCKHIQRLEENFVESYFCVHVSLQNIINNNSNKLYSLESTLVCH